MIRRDSGFSLIELMIAIAIVGIVSAVAVPAYRTYIETANMSKVNAAYENAIRVVQNEYQKNQARTMIGLPSTLPERRRDWKEILNPGNKISAPGGGDMYDVLGTKKIDYNETGAIRVRMPKNQSRVDIFRPAYLSLKPLRARVFADGTVEVRELKTGN